MIQYILLSNIYLHVRIYLTFLLFEIDVFILTFYLSFLSFFVDLNIIIFNNFSNILKNVFKVCIFQ